MAILRRPRYLRCFYCNQRSSTEYDGSIRQFQCRSCEATNYLDKNGDITDPPASTTTVAETTTPFFATAPDPFGDGLGSPDSTGSNGFGSSNSTAFCSTCLKNQHLFVSSLAQYFPSDPNDPDTPELERKYFRFRQGLEQRYPQVCADCEPRVMERIREAGYTAKTDHLRRMVDYSRQVRVTQVTPLDTANWLGRRLWWLGLLLQVLWQVGVLGSFLLSASPSGSHGAEEGSINSDTVVDDSFASTNHDTLQPHSASIAEAIPLFVQPTLRLLISNAGRLQSLCISTTLLSCWWNPFLVQTVRGFTKPLTGIPAWYTYQAAIVLVRLLLAKAVNFAGNSTSRSPATALPPTIAGVHAVAAFFIFYLYTVAPHAIRKDMRPLFSKLPETPLTPQRPSRDVEHRSETRRRGLETLSDVLDEMLTTPQKTHSSPPARRDSDTEGWDGWQPSQNGFSRQSGRSNVDGRYTGTFQTGAEISFRSSNLQGLGSTTPASQPDQYYADEMDWTPTQPSSQLYTQISPHRAFNTYEPGKGQFGQSPQSPAGSFSQTPIEADRGPFWYKVPPAPTSIAQRFLNRPNTPRIIQQNGLQDGKAGTASTPSIFGGNAGQRQALDLDTRKQTGASSSSVEFAQPSFFAEDLKLKSNKGRDGQGASDDDPGSFLSDLFSQTFSLSGSGPSGEQQDEDDEYSPTLGPAGPGQRQNGRRRSSSYRRRRTSISRGQLILRRVPSLFITLASFAGVYFLREGIENSTSSSRLVGIDVSADVEVDTDLLFEYIQPYARLIEAAAVSICAVLALSLTKESIQRWRRPRAATASSSSPVMGILLGLMSIGLAGWMATQMWALLQSEGGLGMGPPTPPQAHSSFGESIGSDEVLGWHDDVHDQQHKMAVISGTAVLPWQWWQLAWLHGAVIVHQTWNMLVW